MPDSAATTPVQVSELALEEAVGRAAVVEAVVAVVEEAPVVDAEDEAADAAQIRIGAGRTTASSQASAIDGGRVHNTRARFSST
jgi:hypothetical protein